MHDRLPAEGHGAGRHRLRASGHGTILRQDRPVRGGVGNPYYGPSGGIGDGCCLPEAAGM